MINGPLSRAPTLLHATAIDINIRTETYIDIHAQQAAHIRKHNRQHDTHVHSKRSSSELNPNKRAVNQAITKENRRAGKEKRQGAAEQFRGSQVADIGTCIMYRLTCLHI